jgi:hypothetical protein
MSNINRPSWAEKGAQFKLRSNPKAPQARVDSWKNNHIDYTLVDQADGVTLGGGTMHHEDFALKFDIKSCA